MKKIVFLSTLLAASGMASAQSSVTLFGVLDVTLQRGSGSVADRTSVNSNGLSSSRLGFRGVEDLGGGMSASFWLESGFTPDNGAGQATNTNNQTTGTGSALAGGQGLTFNRRSTLSLTGGWGELRAGRDYSVHYYNRFEVDPFGNNGVGASQTAIGTLGGPSNTRVSNAVMYFLPANLGGFYGQAQYFLGENPKNAGATADDGNGGGVRLGWRNGPFNVAVAHARTRFAQTATTGDITSSNVAARYNFGAFSLMGGYYRDRVATLTGVTGSGFQLGGIYAIGPGEIKAQYSAYKTSAASKPEAKKLSLGYVHNLSKRTAVYATYARVSNSGGSTTALNGSATAANQSSSGFDLGVKHSF